MPDLSTAVRPPGADPPLRLIPGQMVTVRVEWDRGRPMSREVTVGGPAARVAMDAGAALWLERLEALLRGRPLGNRAVGLVGRAPVTGPAADAVTSRYGCRLVQPTGSEGGDRA